MSKPMSTYLLAYIVSDFVPDQQSYCCNNHVEFKIYTRKDALSQTDIANDVGPKALQYFEDYFHEDYPLPKLDLATVPDFRANSMENWGLIIFRENLLLIDPTVSTLNDIQQVTYAACHEICHQWVGNLVTMAWWDSLWLFEGFATYFGFRAVEFLHPERNSFQFEILKAITQVQEIDTLQSTHPVKTNTQNPIEIQQLFDVISYKKGALLLRMMNLFLGEETFKNGMVSYIDKYKFGNANQDDLWKTLTDEAHQKGSLNQDITVKDIMDKWTLQSGYPALNVTRNYNTGKVKLSQEKFVTIDPDKQTDSNNNYCWPIPLTWTTSTELDFSNTNTKEWLLCGHNDYTMDCSFNEDWIMFNIQSSAFCRVLYDTQNLKAIIKTLNDPNQYKTVHSLNRAQLIGVSLSFSEIGYINYDITFQLLDYLVLELEFIPWLAAIDNLQFINKLLRRTPTQIQFANYMQCVMSSVYKTFHDMNTVIEDFEQSRFRNLVLAEACRQQNKDCIKQCQTLFQNWMNTDNPDSKNPLPRDLRLIINRTAVQYGNTDVWNFLIERYRKSNVATEKVDMLTALACSTDPILLNKLLDMSIIENSIIRKQDAVTLFEAMATYEYSINDTGFCVAKNFLYSKIAEIAKYHNFFGRFLGRYFDIIGKQLITKSELYEFQECINKSSAYLKGATLIINRIPEKINLNIKWMSMYYSNINKYLICDSVN